MVAHRRDVNVSARFTELIKDVPGYHSASRQREVDLLKGLIGAHFDRLAGLGRSSLPVLEAHIAALHGRQVVSAGG